MFTLLSLILTIFGCINWLTIGMLQYDIIAGLFGYQASLFSRVCYIIIGVACLYLIVRIIANKGQLKVYERRKKEKVQNIEASKEQVAKPENDEKDESIFDEHIKKNK